MWRASHGATTHTRSGRQTTDPKPRLPQGSAHGTPLPVTVANTANQGGTTMTQTHPDRVFSLKARISALRDRHRQIDTQIESEQARPAPSALRLRTLKNRKLMLKDEMTYYEGVLRTLRERLVPLSSSSA